MALRPSLILALLLALPAFAQDVVLDDGQHHVLTTLPAGFDPDNDEVVIRDSTGGAPTTVDESLVAYPAIDPLQFRVNGMSQLELLSLGYASVQAYDDSVVDVNAGSNSGGFEDPEITGWDRSLLRIHDGAYRVSARNDSMIRIEAGSTAVSIHRGFDDSDTIMLGGQTYATALSGNATMTVMDGLVGLDYARVTDDAYLLVSGGAISQSYEFEVFGNAQVDIHSNARSIFDGPYYEVADFGLIQLFGSGFTLDDVPIGLGDLTAVSGLLEGTMESGDPFSMDVIVRDSGIIRIVPEAGTGALLWIGLALLVRPAR